MKRLLLTVLLLCVCSAAEAATVNVTASGLTTQETAAANWKLAQVNAQRALASQAPFATLKAYIEDYIVTEFLPTIVREHAEATQATDNIKTLWFNATPAQRAAAKAALGG